MAEKKITLGVINNKIENLTTLLNEVNEHVKETNGRVAANVLTINTIKTKQEDCPARNNYLEDKKGNNFQLRDIFTIGIPILISIVAVVIAWT